MPISSIPSRANASTLYRRVGRPAQVKLREVRENPGKQPEL